MRCATNVPTMFPVCGRANTNFGLNRALSESEDVDSDSEDYKLPQDDVIVPWTGWKRLWQPCTMEVWLCS